LYVLELKDRNVFECKKIVWKNLLPSALHAHQLQSRGYYAMGLFVRLHWGKMSDKLPCDLVLAQCNSLTKSWIQKWICYCTPLWICIETEKTRTKSWLVHD